MPSVTDVFDDLVQRHRELGSTVPDYLRPGASRSALSEAAARLDLTLPDAVVELYLRADGIDEQRWDASHTAPAFLVPSLRFPGLEGSLEVAERLRRVAAELVRKGEPPGLWDQSWFPVFPIWSDEVIAVDCIDGAVWLVWWESVQIHQVAPDLAGYLELCVEHMAAPYIEFDVETGELGLAPGVEAPDAPLEPIPGGVVRRR